MPDNKAKELFDQTVEFMQTLNQKHSMKTGDAFDKSWLIVQLAHQSSEKELDRTAQKEQAKSQAAAMAAAPKPKAGKKNA